MDDILRRCHTFVICAYSLLNSLSFHIPHSPATTCCHFMYDFSFLCFPSSLHTIFLFCAPVPTMYTHFVDEVMSIIGAAAGSLFVATYSPSCRLNDGKFYDLEV
ncbi:hypothetical protein BO79DRAFT_14996 [Aspergillus costaricaensis CBS 115574]|uniref:Uncharacterized protein n=1 Tax=Aspergillus costaricaensis CBS 115574 TaxID=1448317 RepID=A0ACD1IGL1_9EURO|nr:hypothetical protein BO79DRAFT_14996 [Aspergillus costaricaensis CBS 115574]RAK88917.1 hypothetical protein BO79DRAFT_14996 [Aspergillus costaricaensis CBS 115574]